MFFRFHSFLFLFVFCSLGLFLNSKIQEKAKVKSDKGREESEQSCLADGGILDFFQCLELLLVLVVKLTVLPLALAEFDGAIPNVFSC